MKQTLKELKTHVEAKAKTFGEYSPYPISCDDLLFLIRQVEAAQHSLHQTACAECGQAMYHKENCPAINHPLAIAAGKA